MRDKGINENYFLQTENRDLRDRIEILESVIGAQQYDLNQDAWRDLLYPASSTPTTTKDTEANETSLDTPSKANAPPMMLGSGSNNGAISQMAQELIEFRKGNSQKSAEMGQLQK